MHDCISALGKTVAMASANPVRLSKQAIRIFFSPLDFISIKAPNQKLAFSLSDIFPDQLLSTVYIQRNTLCTA